MMRDCIHLLTDVVLELIVDALRGSLFIFPLLRGFRRSIDALDVYPEVLPARRPPPTTTALSLPRQGLLGPGLLIRENTASRGSFAAQDCLLTVIAPITA